ncbi:MAG TPA: phosphatidate cytidylyltransferase [Bryobacteraceae bacterium]|nr:phosphatidate cytidylyltransferase [Bryobacteraceae bacterium]
MRRIVTALVLIPTIAYVALLAPQWLFLAVVAIVALLCFHEYGSIVARHGFDPPGPAGYAAGILVLLVRDHELLLVTLLVLLALTLTLRTRDLSKALPGAAAFLLGIVYVFGCWRFTIGLRQISPHWLFFTLALNWIGDSAAYYFGSAFGRHKLAPRLSPAKSWEGSAASVVASALFGYFYLGWFLPSVPPLQVILVAVAANVAGQVGDLAESALKRGAGVKDSSNLLPGHGGWLDRVDSTLFAIPVVYGLLQLL